MKTQPDALLRADSPQCPSGTPVDPLLAQCRQALSKWMLWNDAYEESVAELYKSDRSLTAIQEQLDHLDALREQAKAETAALLRRH